MIKVDGIEVHIRQDAKQRRKGITEADRVALREAIALLQDYGVEVRRHSGGCSNQNVLDPLEAYKYVAECGCDVPGIRERNRAIQMAKPVPADIVRRNRALQRPAHKPWCRIPFGGSECSCKEGGVSHLGCNYSAPAGGICNKCGWIDDRRK